MLVSLLLTLAVLVIIGGLLYAFYHQPIGPTGGP